jgi:succinylglutamate desuccinylase
LKPQKTKKRYKLDKLHTTTSSSCHYCLQLSTKKTKIKWKGGISLLAYSLAIHLLVGITQKQQKINMKIISC